MQDLIRRYSFELEAAPAPVSKRQSGFIAFLRRLAAARAGLVEDAFDVEVSNPFADSSSSDVYSSEDSSASDDVF